MRRISCYLFSLFLYGVLLTSSAWAVQLQIGEDQRLMLEAAQHVMNRDFQTAETLYSEAITKSGGNIEAYLQRAVVRRELRNEPGMANDAQVVANLVNRALQSNPNDPRLYYQRGMAYRLLRDYPKAKQDLAAAIQKGGKSSWRTDLKAIEMEEKSGR